jgi:hypothetical protein
MPQPLGAAPDSRAPAFNVMLDNQDPRAAVFIFWDARGNFVASGGFESKWLTVR